MHTPDLSIDIYADGADLKDMVELRSHSLVSGFTTNPTLMRQSGVEDYIKFGSEVLAEIRDQPVSFEVFADDLEGMERQARIIASWANNVNVKIPVTNTKGEFTGPVIERLSGDGIKLNITAVFTLDQVRAIVDALANETWAIISVFAGRIADTGLDPCPIMSASHEIIREQSSAKLLWASPREVLNVYQANDGDCDIITVTRSLLNKLTLFEKNLSDYSRETVEMFYNDAQKAGYVIS